MKGINMDASAYIALGIAVAVTITLYFIRKSAKQQH